MKCQLAKIVKTITAPEILGRYIWVQVGEPILSEMEDYKTRKTVFEKIYLLAYFPGNDTHLPFGCSAECIELLPFFADISPTSWEDWIARGGEPMPKEEAA